MELCQLLKCHIVSLFLYIYLYNISIFNKHHAQL
ncbi:hypothetical protein PRSM4_081 [Prochlorococcus phage P-RSM4]|uniref:Uncharacterized protein n=1 Tax=Prochlorococcus phage P-RSM4 TaxID=444862 RepID=E3SLW7_9CAUD|nr:hypothetical protein PRSM4_081 [Prochlorococcus phage P-RSM4]ADO98465.1 hypothetical protein PRSM4_081 [Prochlorococcus phage P-RSM4]